MAHRIPSALQRAFPKALITALAAFGLSGCVTDDYGYGGVSVGYGSGYYDSPYYGGGSYYSGVPYWGWYDNYYYPGTGYYIYDRHGSRHRWSDGHRRYWEGRRGNRPGRENWNGYRRDRDVNNPAWQQRREAWRSRNGATNQQPRTEADRQAWQQRREAWRSRNGATNQQPRPEVDRQAWQQRREAWRARNGAANRQPRTEADRQAWQQRRDAWQARRQQQGDAVGQNRASREAFRGQRQGGGNGNPGWRGRRNGQQN